MYNFGINLYIFVRVRVRLCNETPFDSQNEYKMLTILLHYSLRHKRKSSLNPLNQLYIYKIVSVLRLSVGIRLCEWCVHLKFSFYGYKAHKHLRFLYIK